VSRSEPPAEPRRDAPAGLDSVSRVRSA